MTYVLIFISYWTPINLGQFDSREACKYAGQEVVSALAAKDSGWARNSTFVCVPKK